VTVSCGCARLKLHEPMMGAPENEVASGELSVG